MLYYFKKKRKKEFVLKALGIDLCFFFWFPTWRLMGWLWLIAGHVGRAQRQRWSVCCESLKEGCHPSGWWCGLHNDREEDFGSGAETPIPNPALLLLPDQGMFRRKLVDYHLGAVLESIWCHDCQMKNQLQTLCILSKTLWSEMGFTLEKIRMCFNTILFFKGMEFSIQGYACEGLKE